MSTNIVPFKPKEIVEYEFRLSDQEINFMNRDSVVTNLDTNPDQERPTRPQIQIIKKNKDEDK